jgi:hypothetical protein
MAAGKSLDGWFFDLVPAFHPIFQSMMAWNICFCQLLLYLRLLAS